jgi:hypothetical protein
MGPRLFAHTHAIAGFDPWNPWVLLVDFGTALWLVAYVVAIVQGFRQRTYGIPLMAVGANFTWEILASFKWVAPIELWHIGAVAWMAMDALIVYQLFKYGRDAQTIPELRAAFPWVALGTFGLAYLMQDQYADYYGDQLGFEDAYIINTSMSILFPFMYFARRDTSGFAYAIAWLKMFGTGVTSVAMVTLLPLFYPNRSEFDFMYVLYATAFGFDVLYVALLDRARRAKAMGFTPTVPAVPSRAA